jgi:hypothetical protein
MQSAASRADSGRLSTPREMPMEMIHTLAPVAVVRISFRFA